MLLGLVTFLAACTGPEERLAERRAALRGRLDTLYAAYEREAAPQAPPPREPAPAGTFDAGAYIGTAVRTADRELFDATCIDLGNGARPAITTERARDFFQQTASQQTCAEVAALAAEVRTLEAATR
jgi:hypothetical protein